MKRPFPNGKTTFSSFPLRILSLRFSVVNFLLLAKHTPAKKQEAFLSFPLSLQIGEAPYSCHAWCGPLT